MVRRSNTEERRGQITQGLARAMSRLGYERATIAEVSREAEVPHGIIHYHFKNKQEILMALVDHLAQRFEGRYQGRLAELPVASPTSRQRLQAFLDALVARGSDADPDAMACWVAIAAEAIRQPEVRAAYQRLIVLQSERLVALIEGLLEEEGQSKDGGNEIATALLAMAQGFYQLGTAAPEAIPPGLAAPTLQRVADQLIASRVNEGRR